MKVALVGYGALGKYVRDTLEEHRGASEGDFTYFDDVAHGAGEANAHPLQDFAKDAFARHEFFICVGYKHPKVRQETLAKLVALGRSVPSFVHPASYTHRSVKLGHGVFLYAGVTLDRNVVVGNGCWFLNGTAVAHDTKIGSSVWLAPGVTLCGDVSIGDRVFLGAGCVVSNDVHVGNDAIVGLGTAVSKNVADGQSVIGNPMRALERPLRIL